VSQAVSRCETGTCKEKLLDRRDCDCIGTGVIDTRRGGSTTLGAEAGTAPDHWHLATLKPGGLHRALRCIAHPPRDIPVWPTFQPSLLVRATRDSQVTEPLFPGYLFIQFDAERDPWGSLRDTPGIANILRRPDLVPITMPTPIMQQLLADPLQLAPRAVTRKTLTEGVVVEIMDGPFASWIGRVRSMPAPCRVTVLLSIFGRETETTLPLADIRIA